MNNEAIKSAIQSLQYVYTVVLALSLGEAFKQLVVDSPQEDGAKIHWDRTLSLASFLLLIVPFLQGMNRYFFDVYVNHGAPNPYAGHLLVDCVAFTIESSLFFVLSRSLPRLQWRRFNTTVVVLFVVDAIWGFVVARRLHPAPIPSAIRQWVINDLITFSVIGIILVFFICFKSNKASWVGQILCVLTILFRTIYDYFSLWNFYFPSPGG